jgi:hypothetical protein
LELVDASKKRRKGKQKDPAAKSTAESVKKSAKSKRTVQVFTDITDAALLKAVKYSPNRSVDLRAPERTKETIAEEVGLPVKSNAAILATVNGTIQESDIRKIFGDIFILKIERFPGYFILEFQSDDDLRQALRKNKTMYRNTITVLIGEYSEADEHPVRPSRDWGNNSRSYRYEEMESPTHLSFGGQSQPTPAGGGYRQMDRPSYDSRKNQFYETEERPQRDRYPQRSPYGDDGTGFHFGTRVQPKKP